MIVAAARDGDRERDDLVLVLVAQRGEVLIRGADVRHRLLAGEFLQIVAGVRDHADIEADLVVQAEHIVDSRRTLPAPERVRLLAQRMHMGVPVDDHLPPPT